MASPRAQARDHTKDSISMAGDALGHLMQSRRVTGLAQFHNGLSRQIDHRQLVRDQPLAVRTDCEKVRINNRPECARRALARAVEMNGRKRHDGYYMERWSVGVLEYWVISSPITPVLQYSITPVLSVYCSNLVNTCSAFLWKIFSLSSIV